MLTGQTILLVDEDAIFRAVYGRYLRAAGAQVLMASDAREGLAHIAKQPVSAVLTEVILPGKNGLKFVKDLRVRDSQQAIPVVFLTVIEAADMGLYASLQESLGIGAYVIKQRTAPERVVKIVESIIARESGTTSV